VLGGIILDRVDSINGLGVIMDRKMSMVGRALAMLGFVKRLSCELKDPYTLKTLYVYRAPKLEYASCVCGLSMTHTSIELSGAEEVRN
jgi:hypothetical protein